MYKLLGDQLNDIAFFGSQIDNSVDVCRHRQISTTFYSAFLDVRRAMNHTCSGKWQHNTVIQREKNIMT